MIVSKELMIDINNARQVGFVVYDIDKAIERLWQSFGVGPWSIDIRDYNSDLDNAMLKDMIYHHQPGRFSYKMAEATLGPKGFLIEYIQPLSGENIFSDFLKERGEGMHHIGWHTVHSQEAFDETVFTLEKQGFPCLQSARVYAAHLAYFDTTSVLNTILEVSYQDPTRKRPAPHSTYPA